MANIEDGATGTVLTAPSPQTSGTTLRLNSGESLRYPLPPFYAIAHPNSQIPVRSISEKILVTAVDTVTDIITFVRAVSPYTAKSIDVGWRISNAIFKDDFNNASIINNEVPAGSVNGSNTVFTLASSVHTTGSLRVYRNGIRLRAGGTNDYIETATGFTMNSAPATGTVLLVDYIVTGAINNVGTNSFIWDETPTGAVNGSNATFTALRPYIPGSLALYINGIKQKRGSHFTETTPASGIFTIGDAPLTGDDVMIDYQFNLNPSSNSDTVDGIHANATPTANQLVPLDATGRFPDGTATLPNYLQLRMSGTTTITTTAGNIAFNTVDATSGSKLSLSGNTVLIGAGVSLVEVSYNLMSDSGGSASYLFSRIRKNGVDVSQQIDATGNQFRATSETRLVPVAPGDVISVAADSGTNTLVVGRNSVLMVEVRA